MNILFLFVLVGDLNQEEPGLYGDLIQEFHRQGNNVSVVTLGDGTSTKLIKENGISVLRIKSQNPTKVKGVRKALSYISLTIKYLKFIPKFFKGQRFDWIIYHTLPPELGLILPFLKNTFKSKGYLIVSDTQWQGAIGQGLYGRKSLICFYYRFIEKRLLKSSDKFCVPSKRNYELIKESLPSLNFKDFKIIRWWGKNIYHKHDKIVISKKLGLPEGFWVIYGGNMGIAQKGSEILELANSVRNIKEIYFLLLIRGESVNEIKREAEFLNLKNIFFFDFMNKHDYQELLSSCDIGLILLNRNVTTPSIPSKSLTYYQNGIPILACINDGNDLGEMIENDGAGLAALNTEINTLKENFLFMYNNPDLLHMMGKKAREVFMHEMEISKVYEKINSQLK